jgi:glycerol-3-phosphate dehydrogenase
LAQVSTKFGRTKTHEERNTAIDQANVVIIGGGVVGCAIAQQLSSYWDDVFLLEALPKLGMGASTRNSGVIHSGLYYPTGSLKAKHCVRGNRLTYEFCARYKVGHRQIGKIVVASSMNEVDELHELMENGRANGVENLRLIDAGAIRAREPHVAGVQAIEVPSTGIVESEEFVKACARIATNRGANLVTNARVERLEASGSEIRVTSAAGEIATRCLINSAGLHADEVAGLLGSKMVRHRIYPVRGEYCEFVRSKRDWINGLVYPLPHSEGTSLGVHFTKTLEGNVWVGPTARYIDSKNDYERDREPVEYFAKLAKSLVPEIEPEDFVPAHSGIRAKLVPPPALRRSGEGAFVQKEYAASTRDFVIERDPDFPLAVQLIGIESPGLTSALSIAEQVHEMVAEILN